MFAEVTVLRGQRAHWSRLSAHYDIVQRVFFNIAIDKSPITGRMKRGLVKGLRLNLCLNINWVQAWLSLRCLLRLNKNVLSLPKRSTLSCPIFSKRLTDTISGQLPSRNFDRKPEMRRGELF